MARKMSVSGSVLGLSRLGRRVSVGLDAAAAAAVASATIRGLLFLRVLGQDSRRPAIMVSKKRPLCSPSFIDEERLAAEGEARGCSTVVSACAAESRLLLLVCSEAPAFALSFMMDIVLSARMAPTQAPKAVVLPIATLVCGGRNTARHVPRCQQDVMRQWPASASCRRAQVSLASKRRRADDRRALLRPLWTSRHA